jgi:hypothetical protein
MNRLQQAINDGLREMGITPSIAGDLLILKEGQTTLQIQPNSEQDVHCMGQATIRTISALQHLVRVLRQTGFPDASINLSIQLVVE